MGEFGLRTFPALALTLFGWYWALMVSGKSKKRSDSIKGAVILRMEYRDMT